MFDKQTCLYLLFYFDFIQKKIKRMKISFVVAFQTSLHARARALWPRTSPDFCMWRIKAT